MERGIFIISGLNKSKKESFTNLASIENIKILDVLSFRILDGHDF